MPNCVIFLKILVMKKKGKPKIKSILCENSPCDSIDSPSRISKHDSIDSDSSGFDLLISEDNGY